MTMEELKHKEEALRGEFERKLAGLDVDGTVSMEHIKCVKTFGALWHHAKELLMSKASEAANYQVSAEQVTGLRMEGRK